MKSEKTSLYDIYWNLILKRDSVIKEAELCSYWYTRTFGDLTIEVYKEKISCIEKKKAISYCQSLINSGRNIDPQKLAKHMKSVMRTYNDKLKIMIEDFHASVKKKTISNFEANQIKSLYQKLVKLLHPDINPLTQLNEELKELWDDIVIAYKSNNGDELEKLEIKAAKLLEKLGYKTSLEINIPNIEEKIEDIKNETKRITNNNPYLYKFLMEDPTAIEEKKNQLLSELTEYQNYSEELQNRLNELTTMYSINSQGNTTIQ